QHVVAPIGAYDGLGHATGAALKKKRHAVGEAVQLHRFVGGERSAVGQTDFHLKRIAAVDLGRTSHGGDEEFVTLDDLLALFFSLGILQRLRLGFLLYLLEFLLRRFLLLPLARLRSELQLLQILVFSFLLGDGEEVGQALVNQLLANWGKAIGGRRHDLGRLNDPMELLRSLYVLADDARL